MNVAVFQQNLTFRKRWQAGFGLWDVFRSLQLQTFGGVGGRSGLTQGRHPFVLRYLQALVPCFSVPGHLEKAMNPHVESTLARKCINRDCCFLHVKPFFQGHCYFDSFFPQSKRILLDRPWHLAAVVTEKLNAWHHDLLMWKYSFLQLNRVQWLTRPFSSSKSNLKGQTNSAVQKGADKSCVLQQNTDNPQTWLQKSSQLPPQ